MKTKKCITINLLIFSFFLFSSVLINAQVWEPEELASTPYGIHFGVGFSSMTGGELKNPRAGVGLVAGFYLFGEKRQKKINNFQIDLNFRFSSYKFANKYLGNSAYTKISIISIDAPLMWRRRLGLYSENKNQHLLLGVQPSFNVKSTLYIGSEEVPAQSSNYLKTWSNLPLLPYNFSAVLGYRTKGKTVGFQGMIKVGLLNLNNNFSLPQYLPATGTGKPIRTLSIETSMLF